MNSEDEEKMKTLVWRRARELACRLSKDDGAAAGGPEFEPTLEDLNELCAYALSVHNNKPVCRLSRLAAAKQKRAEADKEVAAAMLELEGVLHIAKPITLESWSLSALAVCVGGFAAMTLMEVVCRYRNR